MSIYEERYCAFVDILGFTELIGSLRENSDQAVSLATLLSSIHHPATPRSRLYEGTGFRAQSISDAVAISTRPGLASLAQLFEALELLTVELLRKGFFVRGAIAKGLLHHSPMTIFGDALIQAYQLESRVVRYPRIMVSGSVLRDIETGEDPNRLHLQRAIRQSEDGPIFVHVLRSLEWAFTGNRLQPPNPQPLGTWYDIQEKIHVRLREARDNPNHFEKVQWFARYWNDCLPENPPPGAHPTPRITGPGLRTFA